MENVDVPTVEPENLNVPTVEPENLDVPTVEPENLDVPTDEPELAAELEEQLSVEEMVLEIKSTQCGKSPGPDGFLR